MPALGAPMSEDMNKRHKAALDVALLDLDVAAIPTKSEVFVRCGPAARDLHDAITDLRTRLQAAEERAEKVEGALNSLRTQADNAAWNAHRSGITIDNAQLVRIFEGMVEQADAALKTEGA